MQYTINITITLPSLIWRSPKLGYSLVALLLCVGTACQVTCDWWNNARL